MTEYSLTYDQVCDLQDLLEDAISFYCDENRVSGEAAWTVTRGTAIIKLEELTRLNQL